MKFVERVPMEPRLVAKTVIADLVTGSANRRDRVVVDFKRGILADDEERDRQSARLESGSTTSVAASRYVA